MIDCLFINPGGAQKVYQDLSKDYSAIEVPTWALLLAQACRTKGFRVELLDCDAMRLNDASSNSLISYVKPRLVCFVVYGQNPNSGTTNMVGVEALAREIKLTNPNQKICVVGSHATALPREVLANPNIDFVLTGEGVYALQSLLLSDLKSQLDTIKGIGFKQDKQIIINEYERIVPQDRMDIDLPGYAWDLLPYRDKPFDLYRAHSWHADFQDKYKTPAAALYTSLGCQYKCSFCLDANTVISMSYDSNKKIKDVEVGDKVLSFNTDKLELTENTVSAISSRQTDEILLIKFADGKFIKATGEHPFFVNGNWVQAKNLSENDECLVIASTDKMSFRMKKYNPTFNSSSAQRSADTRKKNGFIPYMCTEEGIEKIREAARKRASSSDNPMFKDENKLKASLRMRGDKNPSWQGGISTMCQEYPTAFSIALRKRIRKRDLLTCQECGRQKCKLDVHHIDYDKTNNTNCNLITLCASCHGKTHHGREKWTLHYREKMLKYDDCPHYVKIEKITTLQGDFTVYNFQCDSNNNYFANNILTHNCMINLVNRTQAGSNISAASSPGMRFWSPEFIIKEFDKLANYGVTTIRLSDEMFFLNQKYYEPLLNMLVERGYNNKMWAYARVNVVREKYLELFKSAGIDWLALGIESLDKTIRSEVTKGVYDETNIRDVVSKIRGAGISVIANYIFGLPDDTSDSIAHTLAGAIELNTEMFNVYAAMALPGSPLYIQAKQDGTPLPDSYEGFSFHSYECLPLPSKHLSAAQILKYRDDAWHKYMTGLNYLDMIQKKFGHEARNHIEQMSQIKLKRKILGD